MMDILANLWLGLGVSVEPMNLVYCFLGALIGTLIGVLPGLVLRLTRRFRGTNGPSAGTPDPAGPAA